MITHLLVNAVSKPWTVGSTVRCGLWTWLWFATGLVVTTVGRASFLVGLIIGCASTLIPIVVTRNRLLAHAWARWQTDYDVVYRTPTVDEDGNVRDVTLLPGDSLAVMVSATTATVAVVNPWGTVRSRATVTR